jgi:PAS domain S-box-containing protein
MADSPPSTQGPGTADVTLLLRQLCGGPALLWTTGADCSYTFVGHSWQEYTGQTPEEALGQGWLDVVHPEERPQASEALLAAHGRREPFTADYRLRQASGEYRWFTVAGRPRFGPDGEFQGFVGAVLDIHERKRVELVLRRTQQAARFLANASMALTDMSDSSSVLRKVASLASKRGS